MSNIIKTILFAFITLAGGQQCLNYPFISHYNYTNRLSSPNQESLPNQKYHPNCDKSLWITPNNVPEVLRLSKKKHTSHCRHSPVLQIVCNSGHCPVEIDCILKKTIAGKSTWKCYETIIGKNKDLVGGSIYFESCHGNKDLGCINKGSYHFRQHGTKEPYKLGRYEWNNKIWNGIGPCINNPKHTPCGCVKCNLNESYYSETHKYSSKDLFKGGAYDALARLFVGCFFATVLLIFVYVLSELCPENLFGGIFLGGLFAALLGTYDSDDMGVSGFITDDNCDD